MEPFIASSIILVTAMLNAPKTARPDWNISDKSYSSEPKNPFGMDVVPNTHFLSSTTNKISLFLPAKTAPSIVTAPSNVTLFSKDEKAGDLLVNLKEKLYSELIRYLPGATGSDPEIISTEQDVVTCIRFIRTLPAGIPLPSLMRNTDGEIGMYWDDGENYIDINIEPEGKLSMFSTVRSTREEVFLENQDIDFIDANWASSNLKNLINQPIFA